MENFAFALPVVYLFASWLVLDGVFSAATKKTPFWLTKQIIEAYVRYPIQLSYLRRLIKEDGHGRLVHGSLSPPVLNGLKAVGQNPEAPAEPVMNIVRRTAMDGRSMVLYGEPGQGKTTILRTIVFQMAQRAYWIRIVTGAAFILVFVILVLTAPWLAFLWLIAFPLYEAIGIRAPLPLYLHSREVSSKGDFSQQFQKQIYQQAGGPSAIHVYPWMALFVDQIEELHPQQLPVFFNELRLILDRFAKINVIAAARRDIDLADVFCSADVYELLPLDDREVRQFTEYFMGQPDTAIDHLSAEYLIQQISEKELMGEAGIGRQPFWLKLMVSTGKISRSKGVLLHAYCEKRIAGGIPSDMRETISVEMVRTAFAMLSLSMHQNNSIGFYSEVEIQQGIDVVRTNLEYTSMSVDEFFAIAQAAGLLEYEASKMIRFTHPLFQDYFTAYAIMQFSTDWAYVRQKAEDLRWWPSLFLLGGLVESNRGINELEGLTDSLTGESATLRQYLAVFGCLHTLEATYDDLVKKVIHRFSTLFLSSFGVNEQIAVEYMLYWTGDDVISIFEEMYNSSNPRLQILAAILLCTSGIPRCDDLLLKKPIEETLPIFQALGAPAIEYLIAKFESDDDEVCYRASEILIGIGSPIFDSVSPALLHPKARVRRYITRVITQIGGEEASRMLLIALADKDLDVWKEAADGLSKQGDASLAYLTRCVEDPTTETSLKERIQLILSGKVAPRSEPERIDVANDYDPDISKISGPSRTMAEPSAVHVLLKPGLRFGSAGRREGRALRQRAYQIQASGTGTAPAWSTEASVLKKNEAAHFEQMDFPPDFENLLLRIGHADVFVRSAAIEEVRQFGCSMVPYLLKALNTDDTHLTIGVLDALAEVGNMNSVRALSRFRDKVVDPTIRKKADRAIQRMRVRTL